MEVDKTKLLPTNYINSDCSVFIWGMFFDKEHKIFTPTKVKELQGKGIVEVQSGGFFYLCRTKNGQIYGWGTSKYCKYGVACEDTYIPKLIPFKNKVKFIAAGNWHSLVVDQNGDLFAAGHNKYGSCGNQTYQNLPEFMRCSLAEKVAQISAGDGVSLMITQKGDLYSCGHRQRHGHKINQHISKPKKLQFGSKIQKISAGFTHCLVADENGKIYSWGQGNCFQLGHGNKNDEKTPKQIKALDKVFIVDLSCTRGEKYSHSMALDKEGNMYSWGAGYKGKLGHYSQWDHSDPADESLPKKVDLPYKVKKCCAGGIHSMLISQNKEIFSFGCGSDGRLGHEQSKEHRYLYRQGKPRKVQSLKGWEIENLDCSYYHNICLASKKK